LESLMRWASPPDKVVADWPSRMYPSPSASRESQACPATTGTFLKNARASETDISRISAMFFPL